MNWLTVAFVHQVDVYGPPTAAQDASGGTVLSWPAVRQAGVTCALRASPATEQERFDQPGLIGPATGATTYAGLQRGDKLVVTAGPGLVGYTLHVTGIERQPGVPWLGLPDLLTFTGEFQE